MEPGDEARPSPARAIKNFSCVLRSACGEIFIECYVARTGEGLGTRLSS